MQTITAVFDKVSKTYHAVQVSVDTATAIRNFTIQVRDERSYYNQFPNDYELHLLGYFDPSKESCEEKESYVIMGTDEMPLITAQACLNLDKVTDNNVALAKEQITESNIQKAAV